MAKATKVPSDYELTLTLSKAEAEVLRFVMGNIGGSGPARDLCISILRALKDASVNRPELRTEPKLDAIYFA